MRIISGSLKSRRITAPKNLPVRPTTDRAKEGLFNILQHQITFPEIRALDLFCGTGNISFELASRGCKDLTCIDISYPCINFVKQTATTLELEGFNVRKANVFSFLTARQAPYDLIFADPPYHLRGLENLPDLIFEHHLLTDGGLFILEHPPQHTFVSHPRYVEHRVYGLVNFSFFA
ncbi:MAG: 16S rRNA (guanine(966)-N(2))-methyltransferase RsmD [Bacteroidetes bacterium]|nr:MAG: 16S rRNA (guanine(966)-N(2))-methyltransferase RsmD [Bacteroidota bacterium]